jgi:DNA polymerase-3 subunit epsilon
MKGAESFVAIDFETADSGRDSACAVGVVRVEGGRIAAVESHLIRPPRPDFLFTYIHGIDWSDVRDQPEFAAVWKRVEPLLAGAGFLAAHSAAFDRSVLGACCGRSGVRAPDLPFLCTMKLARRVWEIRPTKLPDVCRRLGISLKHHDAESDALACAKIVLAAHSQESGSIARLIG